MAPFPFLGRGHDSASGTPVRHGRLPDGGVNEEVSVKNVRIVEFQITSRALEGGRGEVTTPQACGFGAPSYYVDERAGYIVSESKRYLVDHSVHLNPHAGVTGATYDEEIELGFRLAKGTSLYGGTGLFIETRNHPDDDFMFDVTVTTEKTIVREDGEAIGSITHGSSEIIDLDPISVPAFEKEEYELENRRDEGPETLIRKRPVQVDDHVYQPQLEVQDRGDVPLYSTTGVGVFPQGMPGSMQLQRWAEDDGEQELLQYEEDIYWIRKTG